jgi:hypothetical protein
MNMHSMTQPAPPPPGEPILASAVAVLTERTYGGSAVPLVAQHAAYLDDEPLARPAATITRAHSAPSRKKMA